MNIEYADFVGSFPQYTLCPQSQRPEFAFIGRSNVGKSSLINMLIGRKELAKVSGKPGKTQMLNYYQIDAKWHIVDLPGYGYAKISKSQRDKWEKMINAYLKNREQLVCAFVLIDANIPPQAIDIEFINSLGVMEVPFVIAFTKIDKPKKMKEVEENIAAFQEKLSETWDTLPTQIRTSAVLGTGRQEFLDFIGNLNDDFYKFYESL
jgi:GTP-binding protein